MSWAGSWGGAWSGSWAGESVTVPIPILYDYGTEGSSTIAATPAMPSSYLAGHLILLFVATDGFAPTLSDPQGFALAQDPAGHQGLAAAIDTAMAVFWKRATTNGLDPAPTIAAPSGGGTVICYHTNAYANVRASGTPFHLIATATLTTPSTAIVYPPLTTTIDDCLILGVASSAEDDATFNTPTGTGMDAIAIEMGWHTSGGNDASFLGGSGQRPVAGAVAMFGIFGQATRQARVSLALASRVEVAMSLPRHLAFTRTTRSDTGTWRRTT